MPSLRAAAIRTSGNSASRISTGIASSAFCAKLGLEHLESRVPILFTSPRVALISSVRAATNASRARNTTSSCRTSRPRGGHQHFVPATADDVLHPGRVCPHLENYSRRIQCLKEFGNVLLRRTQLSLRQRFPLQTQNAVVAPSVSQIHTHRQTIEIGAKLTARMLFSGAR